MNTPNIPQPATLAQPYLVERLGWYAQACAHAERLLALWYLQPYGTPDADAVWSGHWALKNEADKYARELRASGALLYAWDGSAVLQGGAA